MRLDHAASLDLLSHQGLRAQAAALQLWSEWIMLGQAAHTAWLAQWVSPGPQTRSEFRAWQERQARTARLIRRGVPAAVAQQGLRAVPS